MKESLAVSSRTQFDPGTFEVLKNSLSSIAAEMKVVLARTAYSPILKSAGDYSCGVFDATGAMVAQGPDLPIHLGSMPDAVRAVCQAFDDFADGDVYIHNDPYFGGSHLPDVNVVLPVFHAETLIAFTCVRAHWPDIGSATPGSYGAVTEIFGEGLRLPPIRLERSGQRQRDVDAIIFANVRTPDERRGDLGAQIAANRRAVQRLKKLADKYGTQTIVDAMGEVIDYSERMMRTLLARLPDGEASFEDFCDGDGIIEDGENDDATFKVKVTVSKQGERLCFDFTGSDPQVSGPMNAPLSVTASGVYTAVKMVVDPGGLAPPNSGAWRTVEVVAPKGSVVNAQFPAPVVYANHEMSHRVADMIFGALSAFMPERVMACNQGTSAIVTLGGLDPRSGNRYVSYETLKGGFGARPRKDGINAINATIGNTMNTPIEVLEMSFPVRIEHYELIADSGGAGQYRGGLGARRAWTTIGHTARGATCIERTRSAPFGLCGGQAGAPGQIRLSLADGRTRALLSKGAFDVPAGATVHLSAPGSGGYGAPADRARTAIREDLIDGYVTAESARRDYGVDPDELIDEAT